MTPGKVSADAAEKHIFFNLLENLALDAVEGSIRMVRVTGCGGFLGRTALVEAHLMTGTGLLTSRA